MLEDPLIKYWNPLFLIVLLFTGCQKDTDNRALFTLVPPDHTQVTFSNQLEADSDFNIVEYLYYYDGGGVAIGDINRDGLNDLFFTANRGPDKLYLNKGDLVFEDISESAGIDSASGWSTGVAMTDINGDGHLDIYVSQLGDYKGISGKNKLYINNGDTTFTESADQYGLAHIGFSTQSSFFDYDNDGDVDMYLLNHSVHHDRNYGPASLRFEHDVKSGDKLFRNDSDGQNTKFTDVTRDAGIYDSYIGYGLGVVAGDINKDGWIDIYISNDFHENDYLYINNGDGTFTENLQNAMGHTSRASMGNDMADLNNDGWLDIVVLDMLPEDEAILKRSVGEDPPDVAGIKLEFGYGDQLSRNTLQLNLGNGFFSEIALLSGIYATDWSWAPLFADFDNDGFKDLFVSNGIPKRPNDLDYLDFSLRMSSPGTSYGPMSHILSNTDSLNRLLIARMPSDKIPNRIFQNNGDLTFTEKGAEWGMEHPVFSNGAAYADLDGDGDLDVVLNNINEVASIYRNNSNTFSSNHFLQIKLNGSGRNKDGIGTKVMIRTGDMLLYQEQMPVRGFQSSVDHILHFGLGSNISIDTLQVIWPDFKTQIFIDIPVDRVLTINQTEADYDYSYSLSKSSNLIFEQIPDSTIQFKHVENEFVDFNWESLVPHKLSTQGPRISTGDVNGDGLDDLFVGGAKMQPSRLFLQTSEGGFEETVVPVFNMDRHHEDIGSAFFDCDKDGDLDLYVVSGGNELSRSGEVVVDRLYINDGTGHFSRSNASLPERMTSNGSCIVPEDFDRDGDLDLFVGSRSVVSRYGLDPSSYILKNDGTGNFDNVTEEVAPDLLKIGLVTDAVWTDFDKDDLVDLVVVGEWMPVTLLRNMGSSFEDVTSGSSLARSHGWWNVIIAVDYDRDGDPDFVAGNLGLNSKIKASADKPATLYVKDFDNNGRLDQLVCFYKKGVSTPFAVRDELLNQIPTLKQRFPTYHDYSKVRTVNDIFSEEELEDAILKNAYEFRTSLVENRGNGTFALKPLPVETQFSPVFGLMSEDFDRDGHLDLLLGGNFFGAAMNYGKYDASYGLVLKGDGRGGFQTISSLESGFIVEGEVRDIQRIQTANNQSWIIVGRNDDYLKIFNWKLYRSDSVMKIL